MSDKFFVFQVKQGGVQTEAGRKKRGPGRPPVGPNIMKTDDGNVYISDCVLKEPSDPSNWVEVVSDSGTKVWYEKTKSVDNSLTRKYSMVNGKLVDEGVAGRGRPARGYKKIETDFVVSGVNLNGHLYNDGSEVVETKKPRVKKVKSEKYESVEEVDEEAKAFADAAADFAADEDFSEDYTEYEEIEETV